MPVLAVKRLNIKAVKLSRYTIYKNKKNPNVAFKNSTLNKSSSYNNIENNNIINDTPKKNNESSSISSTTTSNKIPRSF